ncbi:hypothetical protein [Gemmatimonas sp.]
MDRSVRRAFGAVAFVLMLLRVIAPELGHQCAMDVAPVASAAAQTALGAPASPAVHGEHSGHTAHGDQATAAPSASERAPEDASDHGCDCAEWCCCLPTVADTPRPPVVIASVTTQQARLAVAVHNVAPRAPTARLLPFATAPPAV